MTTPIASPKKRARPKQYSSDNLIEALRSIPVGLAKSAVNSVKDTVGLDKLETYLGFSEGKENKISGDLAEGQELNLKDIQNEKEEKKKFLEKAPGIDYGDEILNREKRVSSRKFSETQSKIDQILLELKKILATTKELQVKFKDVAVEKVTVTPGKYHESFFEWMLSVVRSARAKVENSSAWLNAALGKHAKRGNYWTNADERVGGTSFSLSSERVVSTQVG